MVTRYVFAAVCLIVTTVATYTFAGLAADSAASAVQSANPHSGNPNSIKNGKKLFRGVCARCHGRNGEGNARMAGVANLRKFNRGYDAYTVIVANGGEKMPAWGGIISLPDINDIGSYLETLALEGSDWSTSSRIR